MLKEVLDLGLTMLSTEAREERLGSLRDGNVIDGAALAALIDESKAMLTALLESNENKVPNPEEMKALLVSLDGKQVVADMEPEEIADLVSDLHPYFDFV